ncbi:MAG: D-alanine--D-alanine ligase [Betaproteobacteria bacterium]|nr:D-alanine--D-alanine ligase [Betaproteobacteria bacterium]
MAQRKTKNNRCDVAILVDAENGERNQRGRFVLDRASMEEHVFNALRAHYRNISIVPFGPDIAATLAELKTLKPRMIFNLTEWVDGDRKLDHAIAGLLDIMKFRYTGTGPTGLQICRDKALSTYLAGSVGVDVPCSFTLGPGDRIENRGLAFPLIVKPQFGDGSDEIGKHSLVNTLRELRERVKAIRMRLREPVLCEEFIPGRDIYVGVIGNEPRVLAPTEMVIGSKKAAAPRFATYRLKNDGAYRTKWRVCYRLAELPPRVLRQVRDYGAKAFRVLKLRDYARLDFRLTDEGRLVFIEANPNSDLTPNTLGRNLCFVGVDYDKLIPRIVETAHKRYRSRQR